MRVVLAGGSGQVGTILARYFHGRGDEVAVLSRSPRVAAWPTHVWDGKSPGSWVDVVNGADVVVNLVGHTVNCRYTAVNRHRILRSRVDSTLAVADAIRRCPKPPSTWLQASTATIYADRYDAANDEESGLLGVKREEVPSAWSFSHEVAAAWEAAVNEAELPATRKVVLRSAMVMSPDRGGVFDVLLGLVRRGLGGRVGHGRQFVSWIHHRDFVRSIVWLIDRKDLSGAVNLTSPHPLPNGHFMRYLREAWGARFGLRTLGWMLELGAWMMRTETELVLKSRRVVPRRLLDSGFVFEHSMWRESARELCEAWRAKRY